MKKSQMRPLASAAPMAAPASPSQRCSSDTWGCVTESLDAAGCGSSATTRYVENPPPVLARGVKSLSFKYYGLVGNGLAELLPGSESSANMVEIEIQVQQGKVTRSFTRDVYLRVHDRVP